jgi:hypothetical protein
MAKMTMTSAPPPRSAGETVQVRSRLRIPLGEYDGKAELAMHVDCNLRRTEERINLRCLFLGLHNGHYRLADGAHIDSTADAVRWLLQHIAEIAAE